MVARDQRAGAVDERLEGRLILVPVDGAGHSARVRLPPAAEGDRMSWRAFFRPATLLFVCLWLVLLVGGRSRFFQDPGTFWHTVVGERIIRQGFFDKDP